MVYADYWIALQEGHLTYGTFEDYKSIINRHIKPSMKGLRMRDVLPDDITRMMKEVANFSKSVHDKTYMLAKQMFTNAYDNKLISENPCPKMHAGGRDPVERQALTNEQMTTLIEAVKGLCLLYDRLILRPSPRGNPWPQVGLCPVDRDTFNPCKKGLPVCPQSSSC